MTVTWLDGVPRARGVAVIVVSPAGTLANTTVPLWPVVLVIAPVVENPCVSMSAVLRVSFTPGAD